MLYLGDMLHFCKVLNGVLSRLERIQICQNRSKSSLLGQLVHLECIFKGDIVLFLASGQFFLLLGIFDYNGFPFFSLFASLLPPFILLLLLDHVVLLADGVEAFARVC